MNNTNFFICKANQSQRDYVLQRVSIKDEQERENALIYVAVDETEKIIGRIVVKPKDVPAPIMGKYWYIDNLFVHPEFRRKGIATALVAEIKEQAELCDIIYLHGSANASLEASMFWLNQGFTMNAYGKKQDDTSKPLFYGNYFHFFSYYIRRKALIGDSRYNRIRTISKDEISSFINQSVLDEKRKTYLLSKADDLFGFAIGEEDEMQGVILAFADNMYAPLDGTQWRTFLYVDPQFRHQGIGRALVLRLYQYAQEKDVIQLNNFDTTEDNIGFWYELGFDIFFWAVNPQRGKRCTTAMLRVK